MVANEFHVKRTANQSFERVVSRFAALLFRDIELCFSKVPDTRREDEPEQPHERKDVIGESRSVGVCSVMRKSDSWYSRPSSTNAASRMPTLTTLELNGAY